MLKTIVAGYRQSRMFVPQVIELDDATRTAFVALRHNPSRFLGSIFVGDWSIPDSNPEVGEIRLVAVVESDDGIWVVGRQRSGIYAARG
jgi:hypothetical protein